MANFNSFIDKLDMEFWYEICAKNGELCHYKKGEFFVQQGDVIRCMGMSKKDFLKLFGEPYAKEMITDRYNRPVERMLYQESLYD